MANYTDDFAGDAALDGSCPRVGTIGDWHFSDGSGKQWTVRAGSAPLPIVACLWDFGATACCHSADIGYGHPNDYCNDPDVCYHDDGDDPVGDGSIFSMCNGGMVGGASGTNAADIVTSFGCFGSIEFDWQSTFSGGDGAGFIFANTGRVTWVGGDIIVESGDVMYTISGIYAQRAVFVPSTGTIVIGGIPNVVLTNIPFDRSNIYGLIVPAMPGLTTYFDEHCGDTSYVTGVGHIKITASGGSCTGPGGCNCPGCDCDTESGNCIDEDGDPCAGGSCLAAWWRADDLYACQDCFLTPADGAGVSDGDATTNARGYGVFNRMVGADPISLDALGACGDEGDCPDIMGNPQDLFINSPVTPDNIDESDFIWRRDQYGFAISALEQPRLLDLANAPPNQHPFVSPTFTADDGWTHWLVVEYLEDPEGEEKLWRFGSDLSLAIDSSKIAHLIYGGVTVSLPLGTVNRLLFIRCDFDPGTGTLRVFERCAGTATVHGASPPTTVTGYEQLVTAASGTVFAVNKYWAETMLFCSLRSDADNDATLAYLVGRYGPTACAERALFVGHTLVIA